MEQQKLITNGERHVINLRSILIIPKEEVLNEKLCRIIEMQTRLQSGKMQREFSLGAAFVEHCELARTHGSKYHKIMQILIFYCYLPGHEDMQNSLLIESRPCPLDTHFELGFLELVRARLNSYVMGKIPDFSKTYVTTFSVRPIVIAGSKPYAVKGEPPNTEAELLESTLEGAVLYFLNAFRTRF